MEAVPFEGVALMPSCHLIPLLTDAQLWFSVVEVMLNGLNRDGVHSDFE